MQAADKKKTSPEENEVKMNPSLDSTEGLNKSLQIEKGVPRVRIQTAEGWKRAQQKQKNGQA